MSIELILLVLTVGVILYIFNLNSRTNKLLKNFKGPLGIPVFGNALQLAQKGNAHILDQLKEWTGIYGGRYKFVLVFNPYIAISNAVDAEKILASQIHIEKSQDYESLKPWLSTGLLTSAGKKWHSRRKMLTPAFHFKILEDFLIVMNEQSQTLVQVLKKFENKETFNVFPIVTHAALDIICETAMGRKINAQLQSDSEYVSAIYRISELVMYRQIRPWLHFDFIWNILPKGMEHNKTLRTLHSFTNKVIQEKKVERLGIKNETIVKEDDEFLLLGGKRRVAFLDLLLDAQEKDPMGLPDEGIREEVDTFMFEGHDTTAANANWTIFLLGLNPEAQTKVQEELDKIFGDDRSGVIKTDDLAKMKYLELCIKESLRIYPSVPLFARTIHTDCQLDSETTIPAGTTAMILPFFAHRDPKVFPEPEKFIPERFSPENSVGRHPFAYLPFSAGPRNCIGQKFAMMEEKVMLANVFRNFRVESMEKSEDLTLMAELILRPLNGIKIKLKSRK